MPMDRKFYAENWPEISLRVRSAANWRCQGCGRPCRKAGESWSTFFERLDWPWNEAFVEGTNEQFVLTTAHLDQDTTNDSPSNLKALCTICHLNHDRPYKQANAMRKLERAGQLNLFKDCP